MKNSAEMLRQIQCESSEGEQQQDFGADRRLYTPSPEQIDYDYEPFQTAFSTARYNRRDFRLYTLVSCFLISLSRFFPRHLFS